MKVYGKEHDYYDCALGYGQDPLCSWTRKFVKYECDKRSGVVKGFPFPQELCKFGSFKNSFMSGVNFSFNLITFTTGAVYFCGKVYPFFTVTVDGKRETFYTYESLKRYVDNITGCKDYMENYKFYTSRWVGRNHHREIEKHFEMQIDTRPLHEVNNVPVYIVANGTLYEGGSLKDFSFFKVMDPYTCFQELCMYVSGVLGGMSPKLVEVSDECKIEGKGFDKVTSFRNMKRG